MWLEDDMPLQKQEGMKTQVALRWASHIQFALEKSSFF